MCYNYHKKRKNDDYLKNQFYIACVLPNDIKVPAKTKTEFNEHIFCEIFLVGSCFWYNYRHASFKVYKRFDSVILIKVAFQNIQIQTLAVQQ